MDFHPDNKNVYREIKENLPSVVPFVGAGLTQFAYGLWGDALCGLAENISDKGNHKKVLDMIGEGQFLEAALLLEELRGEANLTQDMVNMFSRRKLEKWKKRKLSMQAVWLLPDLFKGMVITTNFDQTLERVYEEKKLSFDDVSQPGHHQLAEHALRAASSHILFKMHGTISGNHAEYKDIVFTKEQYERNYSGDTDLVKMLRRCFERRLILFLGCSLQQDRTMDVLQRCIKPGLYNYTIIPCKKEDRDEKLKELGEKHIRAVIYEQGRHEAVRVILEQLSREMDPISGGGSCGRGGQKRGSWAIACVVGFIGMIVCGLIYKAYSPDSEVGAYLEQPLGTAQSSSGIDVEASTYSHILLKLSNANHQYNTGLQNWSRLDYARAERDISEAVNGISEYLSQYEIEVAKINNSLGCLYLDMGKYEMAYDYLAKAKVTFEEAYTKESAEMRAVIFSIAQYDYCVGNYERAKMTVQEIIGLSDPETDKIILTMIEHFQAMLAESAGDYETAVSVYERVLVMYNDIVKDGVLLEGLSRYIQDPNLSQEDKDYYTDALSWIMLTYNQLGQAYNCMGRYEEAISALERGISLSKEENVSIGQGNLTTSKLYMNRAIALGRLDNVDEAINDIDFSMRIQMYLFDFKEDYPGLVQVYDVYGQLKMIEEKSEEAYEYFDKALELARKAFGDNHPQTAEALNNMGIYERERGDYEEALSRFETAIMVRRNILGYSHPITVQYMIELAKTQNLLGETEKARESLKEAEAICDGLGIDSALVSEIKEFIQEMEYHEK